MADEAAARKQITQGALKYGFLFQPLKAGPQLIVISAIFNDPVKLEAEFQVPICQCVQIKTLPGADGNPERYRIVLSDVDNFVQSMLATRKSSFICHHSKS